VSGTFDGADHDVVLEAGSLAARAAGERVHHTKSHHHQGVDRVGEGLRVSGWSEFDSLPEAIELPDRRFALGVQWHPEADDASPLVAALVAQAAAARTAATGSPAAG
jgi:putative glutamine amidotransferase